MTVPSNLVPTSITQLPVAPNPTSSATMVCVIGGITYQVPFIDLQSTVSVPASREINTGGGLQGGGDLSANRTFSIATGGVTSDKLAVSGATAGTYGSGALVPVITVSSKGLITSVSETALVISGYVPDTREITAGTGLTGGGNLQANRTISANLTNLTPQALGAATPGGSNEIARADHVHPALDLSNTNQSTGLLALSKGGTGESVTNLTAGAIWYTDGSNGFLQSTQGVNGQVFVSGGASAPTWGSALIVSDQPANYVYSGPASGPDAATGFRLLVNADIPSTLTGKTMSGASNSFSSIGNSSLTNSSVTFNGVAVALGASGTITAAAPNALTIGTGLSGTSYDGSTAVTVAIDSTVATLSGSQVLTNKTINGSNNTLSNIANSSLTNSSVTVGTTGIALGASSLTLGGLTSVAVTQDPVSDLQLATKQYVDAVAQGLNVKTACLWGTTGDITLSGLTTQANGEWTGTLTAGDRILVKNQGTAANNGIYVAASGSWSRSADANTWDELISAFTFVQDGATLADTGWVCTINPGGTLGVTAVTWAQFSGAGTYSAGTGLTLTGTQFSITNTAVTAATKGSASKTVTATVNAQGQLTSLTDQDIAIAATQVTSGTLDSARISGSYTGITGVGTLTAGTWNATTIDVAHGGTGATTLTGYVKGTGTSALTASSTIPNTDISGLGTMSTQDASNVTVTGGSVNGTTIGASTAAAGTFTDLTFTGSLTGTISGGTYA